MKEFDWIVATAMWALMWALAFYLGFPFLDKVFSIHLMRWLENLAFFQQLLLFVALGMSSQYIFKSNF